MQSSSGFTTSQASTNSSQVTTGTRRLQTTFSFLTEDINEDNGDDGEGEGEDWDDPTWLQPREQVYAMDTSPVK